MTTHERTHSTARRRTRAARGSGLALAALVLAACGGGGAGGSTGASAAASGSAALPPSGPPASQGGTPTQQPTGGSTVDACALVTADDIRQVSGLEIKSTTPGPQSGVFPSGCLWELIEDNVMVPPAVSLGVISPGGRDYYDRYFEPFIDEMSYEPIEGVGDKALDVGAGAVLVLVGDALFEVQYVAIKPDDVDKATELAKLVAPKLS